MKNLNLIFNKTYYDGIPDNESFNINLKQRESFNRELEQRNRDLMNTTFEKSDYTECAVDGAVSFLMKTSYPGLLVGTGYAHGAGLDDVNEDINCGFSFDYVTGQPYIPGSSVKGILRNAFRKEVLSEAIAGACGIEKEDVKKLENSIFGTSAEEDTEDEDGVDVFLDAVIRHGDAEKRILSDDYITPHPSPVENPTPIHIIKILPEVAVEFRFVLKDSVIDGVTVDIKTKLELFKGIIGFLGVGAKTNVGYGAMRPYEGETEEYWKNAEETVPTEAKSENKKQTKKEQQVSAEAGFVVGKEYIAKVIKKKDSKNHIIEVQCEGKTFNALIKSNQFGGTIPTEEIIVTLERIDENGKYIFQIKK